MATQQAAPASAQRQMSPQQINAMQRSAVLQNAVPMLQQINSQTFNPANGNVYNLQPRNVGLIRKFIVEVTGTANNTGGSTATLTDLGLANILSNIQFIDLQNNLRHNAPGWQFQMVSAYKERQPYAGSMAASGQTPFKTGPVFPIITPAVASTIASDASVNFRVVYEIPISYSEDDLRGAIYANVVSAQMNLQFTVNPAPFAAAGDDTYTCWYGSAGNISTVTITTYQEYLDQIPSGKSGLILPTLDLSTAYQILQTNFTNLAAGQDYYIQMPNFRDIISVTGIYNSTGTVGGRLTGSDINYLALISANFTQIFKCDPLLQAQRARRILQLDPPAGVYNFSFRKRPISTVQYGNMQLDINPITAGASAYFNIGWEQTALINTLATASSIPANG